MFGALGHQDKNFFRITGESWKYPVVKIKINEFWVPRSCYLFPYHIWALFLKLSKIVPMFGALGPQDENFLGQKT